jgi:ADP-ribose pyrophosphatase YjhB (NUDIX family)
MTDHYAIREKHLVAVDCVIFGYDLSDKELKLLLVRRSFEPEKGKWSLPGGFVKRNEGVSEAACRILRQLTGLEDVYMEQSYAWGDVERDSGGRVITISHFALINTLMLSQVMMEAGEAQWRPITNHPQLIFDHEKIVARAHRELIERVKLKPVGFELLPEKFTLVQLQELYEAIYGRKVDKRNFRKKIISMNLLEKLDEKDKEGSKRGAFYYRFIPSRYDDFKRQGFYFNLDVQ